VVVTADRQKSHRIQHQADAKLAKAMSFASYTASQGDSGSEFHRQLCHGAGGKEWNRKWQELFTKAAAVPHVAGVW
jgi:thioesterase domain-containing protein